MILNDYDVIIKEHFDLFDAPTRRLIVSLEDGEQTQMLSALSNALYQKITSNIGKIDFGTIPRSRGDITKIEKYDDMVECLTILQKLVLEYKQDPAIVNEVLTAIDNIKSRKAKFMRSFAMNNQFLTTLYNLVVLSIEQTVSFLISVAIQYIKDPDTNNINTALDKVAYYNTKDNLLYEQIVSFNSSCANGDLDKVFDEIYRNGGKSVREDYEDIAIVAKVDDQPDREVDVNIDPDQVNPQPKDAPDTSADIIQEEEPEDGIEMQDVDPTDGISDAETAVNDDTVNEGIGAAVAGFGTAFAANPVGAIATLPIIVKIVGVATITITLWMLLIKVFIPLMRNVVYFFMHSGLKVADTLDVQANLIQLNAYDLQTYTYNDDGIPEDKRAKIVQKQLKVVDKLKKWSNKIVIAFNKSDKEGRKKISEDNKKLKVDDIRADLPANVYNKSVLF